MFKKEELRAIRSEFWSAFKEHMKKHRSSNGRRMNWINYPSEVDFIYIRLHAEKDHVAFSVDVQPKDEGVRAIVWEQLTELKKVMEAEMGSDGFWLEETSSPAVPSFSSIRWEQNDLSLYRKEDHKAMYRFLENRLLAFDAFYQEFKDVLVNLAD